MFYLQLAIMKGWNIATVLFGVSTVALLAIVESASNRTLILISLIGSGTTLIGTIVSAGVSLHNSRKLALVAELPQKVEEFRKEVDGRMTELRVSRMETSEAKQEVAHAAGQQQERVEERERQDTATASSIAAPLERVEERPPVKMEIVNKKTNPVPTVPGSE